MKEGRGAGLWRGDGNGMKGKRKRRRRKRNNRNTRESSCKPEGKERGCFSLTLSLFFFLTLNLCT
jgi:hypothetical protein